ncbi:MAG: hypothetical protein AB7I50_01865 [Vicinamibacterales bacterium]
MKTTRMRLPSEAGPPSPSLRVLLSLERRDVTARERLVARVRAEYRDMPGLCLTLAQAGRLFGVSLPACSRILQQLIDEGTLYRNRRGLFCPR